MVVRKGFQPPRTSNKPVLKNATNAKPKATPSPAKADPAKEKTATNAKAPLSSSQATAPAKKRAKFVVPAQSKEAIQRKLDDAESNQTPWRYFNVVWCKFSRKKHKTWEGDAFLMVSTLKECVSM